MPSLFVAAKTPTAVAVYGTLVGVAPCGLCALPPPGQPSARLRTPPTHPPTHHTDGLLTHPPASPSQLRGCRNHHLMKECELVGRGTAKGVALYAHLGVRCPAAALSADAEAQVEVYTVPTDKAMAALDELEDYPAWYDRQLLPVQLEPSTSAEGAEGEGSAEGETVDAWLYLMSAEQASRGGEAERIESGSWKAVCGKGLHACCVVPSTSGDACCQNAR